MTISISDKSWENDNSLVVAATNGDVEQVRAWLEVANPAADDYLPLFRAIRHGHMDCVKELIPVSNITHNIERAVLLAARWKEFECLKMLLEYTTPSTQLHEALAISAHNNDCACLELLWTHTDAKFNNSYALRAAVANRSLDAFDILLPVSDPSADEQILQDATHLPLLRFQQLIDRIPNPDYDAVNDIFLSLIYSGDKDKVRALLPKVDVMYNEGQALRTALQYDDHAMAELLYDGSDLTLVLKLLRQDPKTKEFQLHRLIELEEALRQNAVLKDAVDGVSVTTRTRKM